MASLDLFQDVTNIVSYPAGSIIFEQGQPGDAMYLVKGGQVEVRVGAKTLNTLNPGEIFGEMALIGNEPRSATAVAVTDSKLLPVDEERFLFLVEQSPYFALYVMRVLADRLRNTSSRC